MKALKILGSVIAVLGAIAGIIFLVLRYTDLLAAPYAAFKERVNNKAFDDFSDEMLGV